ncbi:ribosome hibernation-promoting factor, HPF/YfiA family [Zymobacter sp. IVIA_5232.4 C2]|uniref:ribosome hibernation-promoting factor, HPF/YfiA family n=1 Tax=Zymobacter sp. IVIA_5232.4 C2 TaxID=3394855 RepID=UPI0039C2DB27
MQVNITGHHIELTSALRDYVEQKLARLVRHDARIIQTHVTLSVEKERQTAACILKTAGAELHSEATLNDMYAAIDAMADKLDRQLLKQKDKQQLHSHERAASVAPADELDA